MYNHPEHPGWEEVGDPRKDEDSRKEKDPREDIDPLDHGTFAGVEIIRLRRIEIRC